MLSSNKVMDTVNYILTAVICSCEGGLDAHANTERGNILSSERETLVGSRVVGQPEVIRSVALWRVVNFWFARQLAAIY